MTDSGPPRTGDDPLRELLSSPWQGERPEGRRGRWLWLVGGLLLVAAVVVAILVGARGGGTTTTTEQSALSTSTTEVSVPGFLGQPATRSLAVMLSVGDGRVVVVGGVRGEVLNPPGALLDETWMYLVGENLWYRMPDGSGPGPRIGPAAAFDGQSGVVVLFGGAREVEPVPCGWPSVLLCGSPALDDTWLLSPATGEWSASQASGGPSARFGAAVAYDSVSDRVVLFGGARTTGDMARPEVFDDTWVYDAGTDEWTQMRPGTRPAARMFASMAYDPESGLVLLWGGLGSLDSPTESAVWTYDLSADTWTEMPSRGESPPVGIGSAWLRLETTGRFLLIGGVVPPGVAGNSGFQMVLSSGMWEFDPVTGTWAALERAPAGVGGPSAAYDPLSARVVAYGRGNIALYDPADDLWQLANNP
jgi:hypothetical protein